MSGSNRDGFDLVEGEVIISPKIREVISVLEAEGKASVTLTREQLGSGSYSTLSAVLGEWRKERAKAVLTTVPAIPERVSHLVGNLWAEAWKAADANHERERQAFQRERAEHERLRAEMAQEIARLEAELSRVEAERESDRAALAKAGEELERERVERAKAESTARTLEAELTELRVAEPSLASASGIRLYRTKGRFYLESLPYPGLPIFLTFRFGVLS